jgi:nucleolar GTP-binding protein
MFKIPQIEKSNFYIDQAMKGMQEFATNEREKIGERFKRTVSTQRKQREDVKLDKRKDLELQKIRYLNNHLNTSLRKIDKKFPHFAKVDDIYLKLINTSEVKVNQIKDSLGRIIWIANSVDEFTQKTEHKIKYARTGETVGFLMKKYLGKVNSLFRKNKEFFLDLDSARKFMNKLPSFEDLYTICIAGYPNVGKSTLMKKISGSDVEIQNYPFTTKGLMFSYLYENDRKLIQLIDTPGLLGRDKNNEIEERAQIVITEYSNELVFVLDFTESCGYSIESQLKLLKKTKEQSSKNIQIYFSKTDLFDEEVEEKVKENENKIKKFTIFKDSDKLKKSLIETCKKQTKKFDPNKLKLIK